MSYKKIIKEKIEALSEEEELENALLQILQEVYNVAVKESERTGQSIESITYEVLEGVDEALRERELAFESILKSIVERMTGIVYANAEHNIQKNRYILFLATENFNDAVERQQHHLIDTLNTCKLYARENALHSIIDRLRDVEQRVMQWIELLDNPIQGGHNNDKKRIYKS